MIYLDSAATTFQKPPEVPAAVVQAMRSMSSPGRGGYRGAVMAAEKVFSCRCTLAQMFHAEDPEHVVFTSNATHGLNLAIKSVIKSGEEVVISGYEHNAVTRPLHVLGADIRVAGAPLFRPEETVEAFSKAITGDTAAVICAHVSNVFGAVQPIEAIAEICRERGVPLIVDASQSAGILPIDMKALDAAFIAMPGHKGLYGPQGTGVLLCGKDAKTAPLLEGGTGSLSLQQAMPEFLPDRLEAGTHNVPGIAGLLAGVEHILRRGIENICDKERRLVWAAAEDLRKIKGMHVYAAEGLAGQTGVLSFSVDGRDCEEIAAALDEQGVAVRAGLHCAPLAHRSAGTLERGTVRLSVSDFNTQQEIETFLKVMYSL